MDINKDINKSGI